MPLQRQIKKVKASVRSIARTRRDAAALQRLQPTTFEVSHLKVIDRPALESIFSTGETAPDWMRDKQQIDAFEIPDGTGGVNRGDRRAIYYLIRALGPRSVCEVGSHIGASTVHIGAALAAGAAAAGAEAPDLVSVDVVDVNDPVTKPWLSHGAQQSPREMLEAMGLGDFTRFVTGSSLEFLRRGEQRFDFIFLDGDHAAKTVYQEIPAALKALNTDGVILLHDYYPGGRPLWPDGVVVPGPYLATERAKQEGARIRVLPLGELPWPTKLGSRVTSLALLARDE